MTINSSKHILLNKNTDKIFVDLKSKSRTAATKENNLANSGKKDLQVEDKEEEDDFRSFSNGDSD